MSRHRVDLQTPDGVLDCYVFEPAGVGPWPAVVLYMDAFGIRDDLDVMAARLADAGYVVAARISITAPAPSRRSIPHWSPPEARSAIASWR